MTFLIPVIDVLGILFMAVGAALVAVGIVKMI